MKTKTWGFALVVLGVLMLAFMLLASPLHIYGVGFGPKHIIGTVVGAGILIVGLVLFFLPKGKSVTK
jgi:multisubunit Na+/H+ antiporter MnhG subunit